MLKRVLGIAFIFLFFGVGVQARLRKPLVALAPPVSFILINNTPVDVIVRLVYKVLYVRNGISASYDFCNSYDEMTIDIPLSHERTMSVFKYKKMGIDSVVDYFSDLKDFCFAQMYEQIWQNLDQKVVSSFTCRLVGVSLYEIPMVKPPFRTVSGNDLKMMSSLNVSQ